MLPKSQLPTNGMLGKITNDTELFSFGASHGNSIVYIRKAVSGFRGSLLESGGSGPGARIH
jgi:hypothetical protein